MQSKSIWAITLVTLSVGIGASLLPGLGNLGYFSALVGACIYSLTMPYLGVEIAHYLKSGQGLNAAYFTGLTCAIPALLVVLNLIWFLAFPGGTPTCDWTLGVGFFVLGPGLSAHIFLTVGLLARQKM